MDALREQWLVLISTPIYFIIIGIEILLTHIHQSRSYTVKDTATNVYLMVLNAVIDLGCRVGYLVVLNFFFIHAFYYWHSPVLYWAALLVIEDFLYYWLHRFDHEVRFLLGGSCYTSQLRKAKLYYRFPFLRVATAVPFYLFYTIGMVRFSPY